MRLTQFVSRTNIGPIPAFYPMARAPALDADASCRSKEKVALPLVADRYGRMKRLRDGVQR